MYTPRRVRATNSMLRSSSRTNLWKVLECLVVDNRHFFEDDVVKSVMDRNVPFLMKWADYASVQQYSEAAQHFAANQLAALIRKFPWTPSDLPGVNPEEKAMEKFLHSEHRCMRINARFRALRNNFRDTPSLRILSFARRRIEFLLGDKPPLEDIYEQCDFGPGASIGVHGNVTNLGRKLLAQKYSVTPTALPYVLGAMWANAHWRELILAEKLPYCLDPEIFREKVMNRSVLVDYNKITMVPKTAKVHRTIAIEPLLNGYLQKGVDQWMRKRLKNRFRIDLADQSRNSEMAFEGSRAGFNPYVTIDLSSASDSISTELVRFLLPPDWFSFLNEVRSPAYSLNGKVTSYHKFVSMGNGFCFPLETAIFAAITWSVGKYLNQARDYRVYGDDIICRQSQALLLLEVLRFAGFEANTDKTFIFGPFRESCGEDWFDGQAVRPVYLDHELSSVEDFFTLHNSTLRNRFSETFWDRTRERIRSLVPRDFRFMRPYPGSSDGAFQVPLDVFMSCNHAKWKRAEQRWTYREVIHHSVRDRSPHSLWKHVEFLGFLRGGTSEVPLAVRRMSRTQVRWN